MKKFMMLLMVFALGTTMSFAQKVIKSQASSNKVLENKLPDSKVASDLNKGNAKPTFVFLKPGGAADKVGKKSEELKKNGASKATWQWMHQGNDDRIQRTTDQLKKGNAKPTLILLKPGTEAKGVQNIKNVKNLQQNKLR